jgi:hypothetical protein
MKVVDVMNKYEFQLAPLQPLKKGQLLYSNIREKDIETVMPRD